MSERRSGPCISSAASTRYAVETSSGGPNLALTESTPSPIGEAIAPMLGHIPVLLILVGLPGRGKTHMAHKLCRYINWLGMRSEVFLVNAYLRRMFPGDQKKFTAPYFDQRNETAMAERKAALHSVLEDVNAFFLSEGIVAIVDGQSGSQKERDSFQSNVLNHVRVIYIEIQATDEIATEIYRHERLSEEPSDMFETEADALQDFQDKVRYFQEYHVPVQSGSFIRININMEEFTIRKVQGFLPSRVVCWMLNLSVLDQMKHPIYFCRHGESEYNIENRIGGDPELTSEGRLDAQALCDFIKRTGLKSKDLKIWTSRLRRTIQTAGPLEKLGYPCTRFRELNEIHAGICENLTYDEIGVKYPAITQWRSQDKYAFRYPMGESYQDLVLRLEPIIMELETAKSPVLVVSHQAVLRALFAYFFNAGAQESVNMDVPHATVWRVLGAGGPSPIIERIPLRQGDRVSKDALDGTSNPPSS